MLFNLVLFQNWTSRPHTIFVLGLVDS
uniref:Uncharacterized protein n=1 Tax=Arundo donax TaxID=35708 RepID=A0A0A8YDJ8_ARUDO